MWPSEAFNSQTYKALHPRISAEELNESLVRFVIKVVINRGILKPTDKELEKYAPKEKACWFCGTKNGFADTLCNNPSCKRPLDRESITKERTEIKTRLQKVEEALLSLGIEDLEQVS